MTTIPAVGYLRLSDLRNEEAFEGRADKLRAEAARRGWAVHDVIIENDEARTADGKLRPASAFKRKKIRRPNGQVELVTVRPGFRKMLDEMMSGRAQAVIAEDLDRLLRQPRDGEDLLDAAQISGASVGSLSRSIELTEGGTESERMTARIMAATAAKSSADTARRVAAARERLAGQSYGGGRRPYGFTVDKASQEYHRTLLIVTGEAAVIVKAAEDILDRGLSMRSVAHDLNERGVPTVTGARWSPEILRDVLLKPAVAGRAVKPGAGKLAASEHRMVRPDETVPAPWQPILPPDVWEKLHAKLTDPARRTNPQGSEPKWLLSGYAVCATCGGTVRAGGGTARRVYIGDKCAHLKRALAPIDAFIRELVIDRLSQPDAADLLRPAPRKGIDARKLRIEARSIDAKRQRLAALVADDGIDEADYVAAVRRLKMRRAEIDAQLAVTDEPDPLADFRGKPAEDVWESITVAQRRLVVQALMSRVVLGLPGARTRGGHLDPATIRIEWRK